IGKGTKGAIRDAPVLQHEVSIMFVQEEVFYDAMMWVMAMEECAWASFKFSGVKLMMLLLWILFTRYSCSVTTEPITKSKYPTSTLIIVFSISFKSAAEVITNLNLHTITTSSEGRSETSTVMVFVSSQSKAGERGRERTD
ncbi:hypothetical protein Tco_0961639, partial [Tanacetum coccineum]